MLKRRKIVEFGSGNSEVGIRNGEGGMRKVERRRSSKFKGHKNLGEHLLSVEIRNIAGSLRSP